jgi:hypothetical protein
MTSIAEPVQNLSLAEKVCLPPHFAAFYVFYEKPKGGKVETEIVYAASESVAKDAANVNYDAIKPIKLSYSW